MIWLEPEASQGSPLPMSQGGGLEAWLCLPTPDPENKLSISPPLSGRPKL